GRIVPEEIERKIIECRKTPDVIKRAERKNQAGAEHVEVKRMTGRIDDRTIRKAAQLAVKDELVHIRGNQPHRGKHDQKTEGQDSQRREEADGERSEAHAAGGSRWKRIASRLFFPLRIAHTELTSRP